MNAALKPFQKILVCDISHFVPRVSLNLRRFSGLSSPPHREGTEAVHRILAVTLVLTTIVFVSAQNQPKGTAKHATFETFERLIGELRKQASIGNMKSILPLEEIQRDLASLQNEQHELAAKEILLTEEFVTSFDLDAEVLQNLVEKQPDEQTVLTTLAYVDEDLKLKLAHIKKSPVQKVTQTGAYWVYYYYYNGGPHRVLHTYNYTVSVKSPVKVTVRTKKGGREITGYEVWYVAKGLIDFPKYHKRFDSLSSPTTLMLSAGAYFVWAKKDNKESGRVPMDIGGQGLEQKYDLLTP